MTYLYGNVKKEHDYSEGSVFGTTILTEVFDDYELLDDEPIIRPQNRCFVHNCGKKATCISVSKDTGQVFPYCSNHIQLRGGYGAFDLTELDYEKLLEIVEEVEGLE